MSGVIDCGTTECFLEHKLKNSCTIYLPTNVTNCNIPCHLEGCNTEVKHGIVCPIWFCEPKETTTWLPILPTSTSTEAPTSTSPPAPEPPEYFCHPFGFYASVMVNIVLGTLLIIKLYATIKKCCRTMCQKLKDRRSRSQNYQRQVNEDFEGTSGAVGRNNDIESSSRNLGAHRLDENDYFEDWFDREDLLENRRQKLQAEREEKKKKKSRLTDWSLHMPLFAQRSSANQSNDLPPIIKMEKGFPDLKVNRSLTLPRSQDGASTSSQASDRSGTWPRPRNNSTSVYSDNTNYTFTSFGKSDIKSDFKSNVKSEMPMTENYFKAETDQRTSSVQPSSSVHEILSAYQQSALMSETPLGYVDDVTYEAVGEVGSSSTLDRHSKFRLPFKKQIGGGKHSKPKPKDTLKEEKKNKEKN